MKNDTRIFGDMLIPMCTWSGIKCPFYKLYTFVCAKIMRDLSQILLALIVAYFSSILWRKDDMVLAQPFGMCGTIRLWHEITFPFSVVAWTPLLCGKVISL
jgi:hypothetical protein